MSVTFNRKLRKFFKKPGVFVRDALINKYPLLLNQCNVNSLTENIIFNAEFDFNSPFKPSCRIDAVFTWVSSNDVSWRNKKDAFLTNDGEFELYATEDSRYVSHNEIYYSILSVLKHMPWIATIYIVTDNQMPELPAWFFNKVKIVDHKSIIPHAYLPTFNSHVIEAYLHKIPGLSENFIYFNDDFFVAREIDSSHFFRSNGHASLFASSKSIADMNAKGRKTATLSACNNVNKLFGEKINVNFDRALTHTYVPLKKEYYNIAFELFGEHIYSFSKNKFRSVNDLNLATFLVPYLQYFYGDSSPNIDISVYFNIRSPAARSFYNYLLIAQAEGNLPHSFCANDFSSKEFSGDDYRSTLNDFLTSFYK